MPPGSDVTDVARVLDAEKREIARDVGKRLTEIAAAAAGALYGPDGLRREVVEAAAMEPEHRAPLIVRHALRYVERTQEQQHVGGPHIHVYGALHLPARLPRAADEDVVIIDVEPE